MTRYLLDTNHAGALMRDNPRVRAHVAALAGATLGVCIPCVGELWFMVFNSGREAENRAKLLTLLRSLEVIEYGAAAAEEFGRIRTELRRHGRPIPQIDVQIAAIARAGGYTLATADAHFQQVTGLAIEDWLAGP
jgi:tRNA(fMet)-specific endonuclease VapC